jgi:hypothetical protein
MDKTFNLFVALDGFQVMKIDIDERRRRQQDRQTQRKHEPETVVLTPEPISL